MGLNSITLNGTLTMFSAARGSISLGGGSITGSGTLSGGAISGYGTVSVATSSVSSWNANNAAGALTLDGGLTQTGGTFTNNGTGSFNFGQGSGNGVTLNGITTTGSTGQPAGVYNLNNATINGATLNNFNGAQLNVTGNSTLTGTISWFQNATFNLTSGTAQNPITLNLGSSTSTGTTNLSATGSQNIFVIGTNNTLNDYNRAAQISGGGTVIMQGGSITNTSGTGGTTAGLFTIGRPITGYGTISGNVQLSPSGGSVTASGGTVAQPRTLTINGGTGAGILMGTTSGGGANWVTAGVNNTLDLQGNISVNTPSNMNPNGGVIQLDGTTISNSRINSGTTGNTGLFSVVNGSTLSNIAFSTGGADMTISAPLTLSGTATLATNNLTLATGSQLTVGSNNPITVGGNFINQSTTPASWTYGTTGGLGPDLTMSGGNYVVSNPPASTPVNLEVAGINEGYVAAAFINNFALDSLTVGLSTTVSGKTTVTGYVDLVDQFANAKGSGWTPGSEALYLDSLSGVSTSQTNGVPVLNLDGLYAYLQGYGQLQNGLYQFAGGTWVDIIGAPVATPLPASLPLFLSGLGALGLFSWHRKRMAQAAA
jgi:hypothetical protein